MSVPVRLAQHLRRFVDAPALCDAEGSTVAELIRSLDDQYPGIGDYLITETGALRQHVNIFLDQQHVLDRTELSDSTEGVKEISIMQALSGG